MKSVADVFGIKIKNEELFKKALTHPSYTQDLNLPHTESYERLEFLGDAVLKLSVSDVLYSMYPDSNEGEMSKIRSIIVSDNTLAEIAKINGLDKLIILSKHDEKQGARKLNSICACSFEAVLGAYYLDGKYKQIRKFIEKTFTPYITDVKENFVKYNAKEILQEYTQGKDKNRPVYKVISEKGPAHKRQFEVEVSYNDEILATEIGLSKKDAEQKAAYSACEKLGIV
ncbi:ribonuclease III [bacterium]|nr:ribonuclease III [bacterium]MBP3846715.1 ribonuclease III [bacterium]